MAKPPSSGSTFAGKPPRNEAAANGKTTSRKRDTLISLRKDMDKIAARLNQADTLTQQSVASLQNTFSVLEKRVNHESTVNKAALTKRVDQLTNHLTGLITQTRTGVANDLRQAKSDPSTARLQAAVKAAEARVAKAEIAQAAALTKVNRHIADLARAIDTRLTQEVGARNDAINTVKNQIVSLKADTHGKIRDIEQSSAEAIVRLGEHVVTLSNDFKQRTDLNTQAISAKMSTIAMKTQREFEEYRSQLERRMESLEENQRNLDSYADRSLSGLTTRIDNLEYGLTTVAPPAATTAASPMASKPSTASASQALYDDPFAPDPKDTAPQGTLEPLALDPAQITPQLKLVPTPAPAPAPKPFQSPAPPSSTPNTPSGAPVEYVPTAFTPDPAQSYPSGTSPLIQDIIPVAPHPIAPEISGGGPQLYVASDTLGITGQMPNASDRAVADLIGADDLPYEDPAYAENISGADMKRPGAFDLKRKAASGGSKLTSRNMRVGVIALVAATVGYMGLRGFMNKDAQTMAGSTGTESLFVERDETGSAPIADITASTAPAIGEYQDNQGVDTSGTRIAANTLEAAAKSGDPVAEFQLGLSRLEAGQTKQAVDLIRASANKGQPAAQYRLAKLYEAGEGVTADAEMARQLTERAASNGNRIAMHDLALYYAEGRGGVETNIKTAANWFEKAAQRGVVDSQYNLGVLYESGQGLPKNLTEAFVWYSIAAAQGDQFARKHIDVLKQQLSPADVKRAETRIADFNPIALDEAANGIFKNVSWAQPQPEKDARVTIEEAQTLLGQLGYNAGRPDGAIGPQTRRAILSFQRDQGLRQTGNVDPALVVQLQRAAGA